MRRHGTTLVEAVVALALLGVLTGLAAPPLGRLRDRALVRGAREALIGRIAEARAAAVEAGGATLVVLGAPPRTRLVVDGDTVEGGRLSDDGAVLRLAGAGMVELDFDGLGLGRFASATFRLRGGEAAADVVVSAYGRPRRR